MPVILKQIATIASSTTTGLHFNLNKLLYNLCFSKFSIHNFITQAYKNHESI